MGELMAFVGGVAGSAHCLGMCGGFPLALAHASPRNALRRQLLYNFGRLNALVAIGALAGGLGAAVLHAGPLAVAGRVLALVAGVCMVAVGLEMLGVFMGISVALARLVETTIGQPLRVVAAANTQAAPLALGVLNALLPCHLIYGFAARAAATGSVGRGMTTMLAFGLGTVPAMLALGLGRSLMPAKLRRPAVRGAAALVVAFGVVTIVRGLVGGGHP